MELQCKSSRESATTRSPHRSRPRNELGLNANVNDNTDLFRRTSTFCAQQGSGGVRLELINELGADVRHYAEEVWVASEGGVHTYDNPASSPKS